MGGGVMEVGCSSRELMWEFGRVIGVEMGVPIDDVGGDWIIEDRSRRGTASNSGV
jgi:hypothetical protein